MLSALLYQLSLVLVTDSTTSPAHLMLRWYIIGSPLYWLFVTILAGMFAMSVWNGYWMQRNANLIRCAAPHRFPQVGHSMV